jgi:hypothetical protein
VQVFEYDLGARTQQRLKLDRGWAGSYLGYYAWGYNGAYGFSNAWSGYYYVQPEPAGEASTDYVDTPMVVRNESGTYGWWLSNDFNANVSHYVKFQPCCSTPLVGDWDGDGIDSPGVNVGGNRWILSNGYDGVPDHDFYYGVPGDRPLVGDWDGDGIDTVAIRRDWVFYLKNSLAGGNADITFGFGYATDKPVSGDFNGDGIDTVGVRRDHVFHLKNTHSGGTADITVGYGNPTDRPVIGDWNGDGTETPGVQREQWWYLSNDFAGTTNYALVYGNPGDIGLAGDWNPAPMDAFEDEAVTSVFNDAYGFAAVTNDAPATVIRYAPLVYIHQSEANFPASARTHFLKNSELKFRTLASFRTKTLAGRGQISAIRLGAPDRNSNPYRVTRYGGTWRAYDFTRPGDNSQPRGGLAEPAGFYLDLVNNNAVREGVRDLTKVPAYFHYVPGRFITYWFFYPYNDGVGGFNHEGDWERVTVRLSGTTATHIALFRHGCNRQLTWAQISKQPGTNHPIVFAAEGSHGSYGTAADQYDTCVSGTVDYTQAGFGWKTWNWLADVQRQPWYGFGGAWGEVGDYETTTGPLGPSRYKTPAPTGW